MMMRLVFGAMVSLVLLATGVHAWQWPWANPDEMANKLFVEAVPLWTQYQSLPEKDPAQYEARLKLLTQVNVNLVAIVADYPESSLAVELVSTGNVKNLNKALVEDLIVQLEQSIPAAALLSKTVPIWAQYQAMPYKDPALYEARLKLLTQVDANLTKLLADFPRSNEAVAPNIDTSAFRTTVIALEQSIPAAALMAETLPLWDQYQALPTDDLAHNDARLKLLTQVNANFEKILKEYPLSYEADNLPIDTKNIKAEIPYLACASDIQCLLQLAFKTAEGITDDLGRARALAHISGAQAASGDVAGAKSTLSLAFKTAEGITDDPGRALALAHISGAQAASGDVAGAFKTAEGITDDYWRAWALAFISGAQAASGDVAGAKSTLSPAFKTAEGITDDFLRYDLLEAVSGAQAASGDVTGAFKAAEGITDDSWRAEALAHISEAQAASGDVAGAKSTLSLAFKTAEGITDDLGRALALAHISGAQAASGDVAGAFKTAEGITDYRRRAWALAYISGAQAASGDVAGALKTAEGITDDDGRAWALAAVSGALIKENKKGADAP